MKKAFAFIIAFSVTMLLLIGTVLAAGGDVIIRGTQSTDTAYSVYISSESEFDYAELEIGKSTIKAQEISDIKSDKADMTFVFLVDASGSVPKKQRDMLADMAADIIETNQPGCRYAVVSFGQEVRLLQDFTNAQFMVHDAISGIDFTEKKTRLYDGLYTALELIKGAGDIPAVSNIIIITDNANDNASEVKSEAIFGSIENSNTMISSIVLKKDKKQKNSTTDELSKFAEWTQGTVVECAADDKPQFISKELFSHINGIKAAKFDISKLPADAADSAELRLIKNDTVVGKAQFEHELNLAQKEDTPKASAAPADADYTKETKKPETDTAEKSGFFTWLTVNRLYLLLGCVAIAVIILITVILIVKKSLKKKLANERLRKKTADEAQKIPGVLLSLEGQGDACGSFSRVIKQNESVHIGRDPARNDIVLPDGKVSGAHCFIKHADGKLIIADNASTNGTFINGARVYAQTVLADKDKLMLGQQSFIIRIKRV